MKATCDAHKSARDMGTKGHRAVDKAYENPLEAFEEFFPLSEFIRQGIPSKTNQAILAKLNKNLGISEGKWGK